MTPAPVALPMRRLAVALVLLVPLLAGCTAPEEDKPDPLFGVCPQWAQGPGGYSSGVHAVNETVARELGPVDAKNATYLGKPLDLYRIRLDHMAVQGQVEMRAFAADGKQLNIHDYRGEAPELVPVVVFTGGAVAGHEFDVFLAPVLQGAPASPAPVTLKWNATGDASVDLSVTYHYKVCGL